MGSMTSISARPRCGDAEKRSAVGLAAARWPLACSGGADRRCLAATDRLCVGVHLFPTATGGRRDRGAAAVSRIVNSILSLSGVPAYALVGGLAAGEAAAFVGLFLPGEAALLLGGVLASQGRVSLPVMITVAVVAAIVGDSIGYEIGRRGGPALKRSRLGQVVGEERWDKGERFLERRGGPAVLLGRWVGLLRALVPSLAGMGRMPYRRFLVWNAIGGLLWASTVVLVGYAAGAQYKRVEKLFGQASLLVGATVVVIVVVLLLARAIARHPGGWRRCCSVPVLPSASGAPTPVRRAVRVLLQRFDPRKALGLTLTAGLLLPWRRAGPSPSSSRTCSRVTAWPVSTDRCCGSSPSGATTRRQVSRAP